MAGILEGASEGELNEPIARQSARLCRKAGADPEAIPAWIEEGRRRKANASRPPFSDPRYRLQAAADRDRQQLTERLADAQRQLAEARADAARERGQPSE